jgi:hypothetical protein
VNPKGPNPIRAIRESKDGELSEIVFSDRFLRRDLVKKHSIDPHQTGRLGKNLAKIPSGTSLVPSPDRSTRLTFLIR